MADTSDYAVLAGSARDWVLSTRPKTAGSNNPDYDHIRDLLAPKAVLRFGHSHFVSTAPHLQRDESPDDLIERLKRMSSALETWSIDVIDINADLERKSAVVRAMFHMKAKNDPEVIHNEILFWCQMDESGRKILESTEFLDPTAMQALKPKLEAAMAPKGSL